MDNFEKEIVERITAGEQSVKSLHKRQDHSDQLVESVAKMASKMEHMSKELDDVSEKVNDLESKPAKRWESVIAAIIGAVSGSIGTALIGMLIK